ncbi:kinase-like domain-containing protein, partial [Blastocladiella britannica]
DFRLGEVLGHGASGQVFSAYTSLPEFRGIPLAIKRIARSSIRTARAGRRVANEITIQSRLRHRALVRMYASFHDAEYIYMLMEACEGGTVFEYLQLRGGRVSEPEARGVVRSVVDGLMHLQQNRIMHRDLKPGNLLITADGDVKIGDFGLATMIQPPDAHPLPPHMLSGDADGSNKRNNHQTLCGTPNFIAPEIVVHQQYSTPVDMWSLGCLMVMLLTGKPPFETEDGAVEGTFKRAAAGVYQIPRELGLSADARDLIATLLQLHPEKRGKLEELVAHPWLDSSLP